MRSVLLAAALFAHPGLAGANGGARAPAVVQLSLSFAAPPIALAAPAAEAGLPNAGVLAGAALASSLAMAAPLAAPDPVLAAFHTGDPSRFLDAVRKTGYDLPRGDEQQERLLREAHDLEAAERWFDGRLADARPSVRGSKLDLAVFGRELRRQNPREGIFQDAEAKRRILRAAGYTHLKGQGGARIPIAEASDARVGQVFQGALRRWRAR